MKLADYSDRVTADQLDTALRLGSFEGVFHYLKGTPGFILRIELPDVVTAIRAKGWPQLGIDVPFNPSDADGVGMARTASSYGFPSGSRMYLDIEPGRFAAAPNSWPAAADAWCDGVRTGGFSPGIYGTDVTVAACANHADTIWRAKPGMCDPAGPGLNPTFFASRRIVQCDQVNFNGISFDVSYSQFTVGVDMTADEHKQLDDLYQLLVQGSPRADGFQSQGWIKIGVDQLLAKQATVDVNALATALATHPLTAMLSDAERDAVATHVLQHLSKDTAAG